MFADFEPGNAGNGVRADASLEKGPKEETRRPRASRFHCAVSAFLRVRTMAFVFWDRESMPFCPKA